MTNRLWFIAEASGDNTQDSLICLNHCGAIVQKFLAACNQIEYIPWRCLSFAGCTDDAIANLFQLNLAYFHPHQKITNKQKWFITKLCTHTTSMKPRLIDWDHKLIKIYIHTNFDNEMKKRNYRKQRFKRFKTWWRSNLPTITSINQINN